MFIVRLFYHDLKIETGCTMSVRQITMRSMFLVLKVMMLINDSPLAQQKALELLQQTELEILKAASSVFPNTTSVGFSMEALCSVQPAIKVSFPGTTIST